MAPCGNDKRQKRKHIETFIQSQKGSMDKFVVKKPHGKEQFDDIGVSSTQEDIIIDNTILNGPEMLEKGDDIGVSSGLPVDIYDPRNWVILDLKSIERLAINGPKRDLSIVKGRKNAVSRRFLSSYYTKELGNRETSDRKWLVYSKELDVVFCFCCKIFKKGIQKSELAKNGISDWTHVLVTLKFHEKSKEHMLNMKAWIELRLRFKKNETIDKRAQEQYRKEKDYWKNVLIRIFAVVKYLAKHNLAFRGTNARLYQKSNGNFLGLIETLAEFNFVIKDHVSRIKNGSIHHHYLSHNIQNELILLIASRIKSKIITRVKEAKHFSVILDCTPDARHQEQMSLILRCVHFSSDSFKVEEYFIEFVKVDNTTGLGLFDVLKDVLKSLDLDIDNVRGQGYDNGSNMKGNKQGVQRRLLDVNPRAFYTPCACHSLNLVLCDISKKSRKVKDFFGVVQRLYSLFANSNKRWDILKKNVKSLTLKQLSMTRWESRVESIKAIRFQIEDVREALFEVAENDYDLLIQSEAKSLAMNELSSYEFLLSTIIWFDILHVVNLVSKKLQSKDMQIDVAMTEVSALISHFKKFRETGFVDAMVKAKDIASEIGIEATFIQKRIIRRKRQFHEINDNDNGTILSEEEAFRSEYFLYIVDHVISSLHLRFEQYQSYESIFGFLFDSTKLKMCDDPELKSRCSCLENSLKNGDLVDINGDELYVELKFLIELLPNEKLGALDILNFLVQYDYFPYTTIAYKILLTIPITVASAERSFSKLKLLKSYLRASMSQDRLNGLALMAIESTFLEELEVDTLVDDFASKHVNRMALFT